MIVIHDAAKLVGRPPKLNHPEGGMWGGDAAVTTSPGSRQKSTGVDDPLRQMLSI
jgi:hypothetical protein